MVGKTWTLCSVPDAVGALREMRRVLRKDGQLLLSRMASRPSSKPRFVACTRAISPRAMPRPRNACRKSRVCCSMTPHTVRECRCGSGTVWPFAKEKWRGRGVAIQESFGTVVAQIAEVTVTGDEIQVDRIVCVVDCGIVVTPDVVRAQMQSGIGFGLAAAFHGKFTLTDGYVDQTNFHQYPASGDGNMSTCSRR